MHTLMTCVMARCAMCDVRWPAAHRHPRERVPAAERVLDGEAVVLVRGLEAYVLAQRAHGRPRLPAGHARHLGDELVHPSAVPDERVLVARGELVLELELRLARHALRLRARVALLGRRGLQRLLLLLG